MQRQNRNLRDNSFPTPVKQQPVQVRVFRYQFASSTTVNITTRALMQLLGVATATGAGTSQLSFLLLAYKINRVSMWGVDATSAQSANSFAQVRLLWSGGNTGLGKSVEIVDYGTSAKPAHVASSPPPGSEASMWHNTSSANTSVLLTLTGVVGSIVDVEVQLIYNDAITAPFQATVSSNIAAVGGLYTSYLDNYTTGGAWNNAAVLAPVGASSVL